MWEKLNDILKHHYNFAAKRDDDKSSFTNESGKHGPLWITLWAMEMLFWLTPWCTRVFLARALSLTTCELTSVVQNTRKEGIQRGTSLTIVIPSVFLHAQYIWINAWHTCKVRTTFRHKVTLVMSSLLTSHRHGFPLAALRPSLTSTCMGPSWYDISK